MQRARIISIVFLALMVIGSIGLDQVSKVHAQNTLMKWTDDKDPSLYQGQRYPLTTIGSPLTRPTPAATPEASSAGTATEVAAADKPSTPFFISFSFNYVRNLGAAWGALSTLPDSVRIPFFYGVTVLAVLLIGVYIRATPIEHRLAIFALTLVLSGAIGNFIDRLRLGYVIDFIDVRWNILGWRYDFPNFNVADSAITCGVAMLIFDMLVLETLRRRVAAPA